MASQKFKSIHALKSIMSNPQEIVEKAKTFLHKLAITTSSDIGLHARSYFIGRELGYDDNLTDRIVSYLKGQAFITGESNFYIKNQDGELVTLTSRGLTFLTEDDNNAKLLSGNIYTTNNYITNNIGSVINSHFQQVFNDPQAFQVSLEKLIEFVNRLREQTKEYETNNNGLKIDIDNLEKEIRKPVANWKKIQGWINIIMLKLPFVISSVTVIEKLKAIAESLFGSS